MSKLQKVHCHTHGRSTWYAVCAHVLAGNAAPGHIEHPTDECPAGLIECNFCRDNARQDPKLMDGFMPVCKGCAERKSWTVLPC